MKEKIKPLLDDWYSKIKIDIKGIMRDVKCFDNIQNTFQAAFECANKGKHVLVVSNYSILRKYVDNLTGRKNSTGMILRVNNARVICDDFAKFLGPIGYQVHKAFVFVDPGSEDIYEKVKIKIAMRCRI